MPAPYSATRQQQERENKLRTELDAFKKYEKSSKQLTDPKMHERDWRERPTKIHAFENGKAEDITKIQAELKRKHEIRSKTRITKMREA